MGGRHALAKPHHLYISPPTYTPSAFHVRKSSYPSPVTFIQNSSTSVLSVGDRIPGFKVSAAFLSSLHTNIFIELDSTFDPSDNTPYGDHHTIANLRQPSSVHSMASLNDADFAPPAALNLPETKAEKTDQGEPKEPTVDESGIPLLKNFPAEDSDTRAEALHIIADSVAQQRNLVSSALIYHPFAIGFLVAAFAFLRKYYYYGQSSDYILILTLFTGVTMTVLGGIRLVCAPYIFEAEKVGTWKWLDQGRSAEEEEQTGLKVLGEADEILVTKFGGDYIGAIIFRGVQPSSSAASPAGGKKTRKAQSSATHNKMLIRGWSVGQKYRRKEVGTSLLEDALRIGKQKGWTTDGVEFAADHANHKRVVPNMFNGALIKYQRIAQKTLDKKLQELEGLQEKGRKRK